MALTIIHPWCDSKSQRSRLHDDINDSLFLLWETRETPPQKGEFVQPKGALLAALFKPRTGYER